MGWDHVVLVVRSENESAVRSAAGDRIARHVRVDYAVQDAALPEDRVVGSQKMLEVLETIEL